MKTIASLLVTCLLSSLAYAGSARDLPSTAAADGRFTTLVAALQHTGLDDTLRGAGPFTVFAPTDEAFEALPDGALATLLRPENRAALERLLLQHVVAGRILSTDLLATTSATTLAGSRQPLGLRVGSASVVQADVVCTNGVIHVIDRVLLSALTAPQAAPGPETERMKQTPTIDVAATIAAAIDQGAPAYNDGHIEKCARIYHDAATRLVEHAGEALAALDRMDIEAVLAHPADDPKDRAWNLRYAFDRILMNQTFEPVSEAELPDGFPKPGPVGRVVVKRYPSYRAARAEGGNSFWALFQHIKKNDVAMTAPVEMTMGAGMRAKDMAFLYPSPTQGRSGAQGGVQVLDLKPIQVLSIGVRGRRDAMWVDRARKAIEAHMQAHGIEAAGAWRVLGYNSPMVPSEKQYWELQVPVQR